MGIYYLLVNDTTKESLHLDYHIKSGSIRSNQAVHRAFVNYMFEHPGDVFRIISDTGAYDECDDYKKMDLLNYIFSDGETMKRIVSDLNIIHASGRYVFDGSVGSRCHIKQRAPDRLWARTIFSLAKWLIDLGNLLAYYGGR